MGNKFSIRLNSKIAKKGVTGAVLLFLGLLRQAFKTFSANDPLRMAAATAFFTTFALPPILIIIIQALGLVFDGNLSRGVFSRLSSTIGRTSTHQIIDTLKAFREMASNWYVTVIGFVILVFVATNLFKIIKDSINQLWRIRMVAKQNFWKTMKGRWQAFVIIMLTGTLFCFAILIEGMQTYLSDELVSLMPGIAKYLGSVLNYGLSVVFVTAWFVILFRYLPDGRPLWTVAIAGAFFTSIFFNIGKIMLRMMLNQSNLNNFYGASASIVLLLLFVFYSSLILYFGAAFTKAWADYRETPIVPKTGAIRYRWSEIHEE